MNYFMHQAVKEAFSGVEHNHGGPFGAVIVKDGKIISKAHNQVIKNNDPTAHAEMSAIKKASKKLGTFDLSGCEIYTTCMPCPMCLGAIKWANIKTVYYGASSRDADNIGFRDEEFYEKETLELKNIDRDECLKPFEAWSAKEDKTLY
ncbi:nucleoside deaminase [Sulfurimonas sp.]|uniref:nucleoside deaminase n=1 Tax=Sulfurimonas sp. TaxID=2022749 RepID=UPI002A36E9B7|nr:nucleoside deaminase [Sulfurimonas sp.]MDY0123036.1 nucleoside deaminase [Sulfurimonas sp.]